MSRIKWSQKGEKINMYFDEESQVITSIAPSGIYYQTENGLQFFHHERLDDSDVSNLNDFIRYLSVDKEIKLININENSIEVEIDGQPILLTEYVAFSKNSSHDLYLSTPSMYHLELNDEEWVELVLQQKDVLFKNMDWDFAYPGGINLEEEAMERLASGKGSNIDIDDISSKALIEMTELDKEVSGYDYVLKISQDNKEYIAFINAEEFDLLQTRVLTEKALVEDCSGTMSALEFINYGKLVIKKDETGLVLIDSDFIDTNDNEYFGKVKFMPSVISEGSSFNVIVELDGLQTCYPITADSEFISDSDISFSNGVSENLAQYIEEPQKNTERINCKIVDLDYNANNNRINGIVNMLNVEMQISGIPDSFDFESKTISIKGINYPVDIDDAKWEAIVQKFKENNLIQSKNCGELVQIPQIEKDKLVYALAIRDSDNNLFGINDERILKLDEKAGYSIIKEEDCLRILYLKEIAAQPFNVSKIDDITLIDTANKVIVSKDGIIRLTNDSMEEFLSKGNELLKKMQKQGDLIVSNDVYNKDIANIQPEGQRICSLSSYPSISDVQLTKVSSGVLITGKLEDNSEFSSKLESININSNNGNNTLNVTTNNGTFNVLSFGENKEFNVEQISKLQKEVSTLVSESKELKQIFINNGNMYAKFNDEYLCINKPSMGALEKLDGKTTSIQVTASQYNEIVDAVFDGNTKFKIVSEKENEGKLILHQINDSSLISGNHKISLNIVGIEEKEEPISSSSVTKEPEPDGPNSPKEIKETIVGCEL